jgi:hypothetical protein
VLQASSPAKTSAYRWTNISDFTAVATACSISAWVGQTSRRKTGAPSLPSPSGSVARSMSIRPARA